MLATKKISYAKLAADARADKIPSTAVCGIIVRDDKVLLIKRASGTFRGGVWEIPGGKTEKGEALNLALAREIREETNLKLSEIKNYVGHFDYAPSPKFTIRLFMFEIAAQGSEVITDPSEHTDHMWATLEQARGILNPDGFTSLFLSYMDARK